MAEMMSTKLCNYMLDTGSLKGAFTNMEVRIYSGTPPTQVDAAITGTLICKVKNGGSYCTFGSATGGTIAINTSETWVGTNTTGGTLVATHYRLVSDADVDDGAGATMPRVQGSIGTGGSDMNVGSASIANNATFPITTFTQSILPN